MAQTLRNRAFIHFNIAFESFLCRLYIECGLDINESCFFSWNIACKSDRAKNPFLQIYIAYGSFIAAYWCCHSYIACDSHLAELFSAAFEFHMVCTLQNNAYANSTIHVAPTLSNLLSPVFSYWCESLSSCFLFSCGLHLPDKISCISYIWSIKYVPSEGMGKSHLPL